MFDPLKPFFERTFADDLMDSDRAADPTPHEHFHRHPQGGEAHAHTHAHSEEVGFPHAHSARTDLPAHEETK